MSHILDARDIAADLEFSPDANTLDVDAMARMLVARYPDKALELCEALSDHNTAIGDGPRAAEWDGIAVEAARLIARRWS